MAYLGNPPATGQNNSFRVLDDITSYTLTFDGSSSSVVNSTDKTIESRNHRFVQGQRVVYGAGGGTPVANLTGGTAYFIIKQGGDHFQLATSATNASNGVAISISAAGSATSHTLIASFDAVNTRFLASHSNGIKVKITRSAQLNISINGVIQEPQETATPTAGFGRDSGSVIVFSTAPNAGDAFWGSLVADNVPTFDISDNDVDNFTGDNSTTDFTLSKTPPDARNILVTLDGVTQHPSDNTTTRAYTVTENILSFTSAPSTSVSIQVRHIGFAGATGGGSGVTNFYGRTGSVVLKNTDTINVANIVDEGYLAVGSTASFGGNVSIGGTLTYEDVTYVDSIGIITAQSGINNTGGNIKLGDTAVGDYGSDNRIVLGISSDLQIYHDGDHSILSDRGTGNLEIHSSTFKIRNAAQTKVVFTANGASVKLFSDNNEKLSTIGYGVTVVGDLQVSGIATVFSDLNVADKIIHAGDPDTMLRFPSANMFTIETGGTERFRINTSGRVGIGTTAPARDFHVEGTSRLKNIDVVGFSTFATATKFFHHTPKIEMQGGSTATLSFCNATSGTTTSDGMLMGFSSSSAAGFINVNEGGHGFILKTGGNGTGNERLNVSGVGTFSIRYGTTEEMIRAVPNKQVELYFNGNERLKTTTDGVIVSGILTATEEVAAQLDYPNFTPTLDFNFAAVKKLDPRFTFSRKGTASYYDEFGNVVMAASNQPRFDHDPDTREAKGLLIEPERTNTVSTSGSQYSSDIISGGVLGGTFQINDVKADIILPTGESGLVRHLKADASSSTGMRWGSAAGGTAGNSYAGGVWARAVSGTVDVNTDVNDRGSVTHTLTEEWKRVSSVGIHPSNDHRFFDFFINSAGNEVYIWGVQLEENVPFLSSYIHVPPNHTSQTRGADFAKIDGQEFTEFYSPAESTTIMIGQRLGNQQDGRAYSISDGSNDNRIDWDFNDDIHIRFSVSSGGTTVTTMQQSNVPDINDEFRIAAAVKLNDQIGVVNGTAISSADTSCAQPVDMDRLYLGLRGNEGNQGALTIKRFMYYPKRLPNSQLLNLTKKI